MSEPFLGEVKILTFSFAPKGWALCNGQLLPISQNQALFALLGTYYGGNGTTSFALPNLQGRVPIHWGAIAGGTVVIGAPGGADIVTLTVPEIPAHTHLVASVNQATAVSPATNVFAAKPRRGVNVYAVPPANTLINSKDVVGGGQAHDNRQPYLVLNFVIALSGIFPSQN
jgi:microcystin-dependent protein